MEIQKFKINENISINDYLSSKSLGKHRINFLIDNKKIKKNKQVVSQNEMLNKNDVIYIDLSDFEKIDYEPYIYDLDVLYEDDYLMIVNKPKGMICYSDQENDTLANVVRYYYQINNINRSIRHVQRLDKDTTGLILYAKDFITQAALDKMIENNELERFYLAKVMGKVKKSGSINLKMAKDRHINNKMIVNDKGMESNTLYKLVEYDKDTDTSVVLAKLITGRTHQIRLHFAYLNHPLIGDKIYNPNYNNEELQLLSYRLRFIHPITNKLIDVRYQLTGKKFENLL